MKSLVLTTLLFVSIFSHASVRIMPMGDSITEGNVFPGGYRVHLEQLLSADSVAFEFVGSLKNGPADLVSQGNEGHGGWKIADVAANVDGWIQQSQPDVILLLIGTNDLWVRPPESGNPDVMSIAGQMRALIDQILRDKPDVKLLIGSLPPTSMWWAPYVPLYNTTLKDMVESEARGNANVHFVDLNAALTTDDLVDGVHPTQPGYDKLAEAWFKVLNDEQVVTPEMRQNQSSNFSWFKSWWWATHAPAPMP